MTITNNIKVLLFERAFIILQSMVDQHLQFFQKVLDKSKNICYTIFSTIGVIYIP